MNSAARPPYGSEGGGAYPAGSGVTADRGVGSVDDDPRDKSVGALLGQLASETTTLVRQEIKLAQAEITNKAKTAGKGVGMLAGAAVMGLALLGAFTALLILLFHIAVPAWAAALIVTGVYAIVVAVFALAGRRELQRATPPKPEQAIDEAKEDVQWAKTLPPSARR